MSQALSPGPARAARAMVVLPAHLHARPAGALVQAVARFSSTVELTYGGRTVNARGVLGVMSLGALAGSIVHGPGHRRRRGRCPQGRRGSACERGVARRASTDRPTHARCNVPNPIDVVHATRPYPCRCSLRRAPGHTQPRPKGEGLSTMMGPSHALSGAAVWLGGSWALE